MDLDAPLDITIGPYETYDDELFGYKASFEAFINLRDEPETKKVSAFTAHLQEIEDNLPIDPQYRNPKLGAAAPVRVVDEILSAGDGNRGIATAAYNLPNDDRVVQQKGQQAGDDEKCTGGKVPQRPPAYRPARALQVRHGGR